MTTELVNPYQSLIISVFDQNYIPNSVTKTKPTFTGSQKIAYLELPNIEEAAIQLRNHGRGILIYGLSEKDDLQKISHFLDSHANEIQSGAIRVVVFDKFMSERIHKKLASLGASEILHSTILEKAFLYKIVLNIQLLEKKWQINAPPLTNKLKTNIGDSQIEVNEPMFITQRVEPIWVDALTIDSDCFIVDNPHDVKSIADRWVIELVGPGPANGKWEKIDFKNQFAKNVWQWKPHHPETDFFVSQSGRWLFFGSEPTFQSTSKKWKFISEKPTLAFFYDANTCLYRFHIDTNNRLLISKNSENALKLKDDILASIQNLKKIENDIISGFRDDDIDWSDAPSIAQLLPSNEAIEKNIPGLVSGDAVFKSIGIDIQLWKVDGLWKTTECVMIDHGNQYISIDSPVSGLNIGDKLRVLLQTISIIPSMKEEFIASIKTIDLMKPEDTRGMITLQLPPDAMTAVSKIFVKFESRQNEVFNLFKEIRGY